MGSRKEGDEGWEVERKLTEGWEVERKLNEGKRSRKKSLMAR